MYRVNEKFDVHAIQGGIVHREVNETVEADRPRQRGLDTQWRILDHTGYGNYILAYYCGRVTENWFFEGSVVYSRTPTLADKDLRTLQVTGTNLRIDFNTYCKPKTSGCI
ncbi:hypothetical protein KUTeg_010743 [Tegillarca granosa]|uniref:VDE lipocalin domain-containing protein n=1 Tax=Tegillarca granosa TaxID=220873 RepID=A0ABQ9F1W7_TEGGR|nr:hypothetical protein KUTeg_010743 [Tegillarca granosa]